MASVVLKTFRGGNITPQNDAIIYQTVIPGAGVFKGCDITVSRGNVLHIAQGYGMIKGRFFEVYENEISVMIPESGSQPGRLYLHMDLSNADEPIKFVVETGEDLPSLLMDQNVNYNNSAYDLLMAQFHIDAGGIKDLMQCFPYVQAGSGGSGGGAGGGKGITRDTAYTEGDIVQTASAPGWCFLVCTQAGTTALGEPSGYGQITKDGDTVLDGTAIFTARDIMSELDNLSGLQTSIDEIQANMADPSKVKTQLMALSAYNALKVKDQSTVYFCYDNTTSRKITNIYWGQTAVYAQGVQVTYYVDKTQIKRTVNMYDDALLNAPDPTIDGFEFVGWKESSSATPDVLPERQVVNTSSFYLYALYKRKVEVIIHPNGGTLKEGKTAPVAQGYKYYVNGSYSAPEVTIPECPYEIEGLMFAGYASGPAAEASYYPGDLYRFSTGTVYTFDLYATYIESEYDFPFVNGSTMFKAPAKGLYELEVYGAAGGDAVGKLDEETVTAKGGKGGHAKAYKEFTKGATIYVVCGSKGATVDKNSNTYSVNSGGGGASTSSDFGAVGGGATHIGNAAGYIGANGLTYDKKSSIYIVAGGGGAGGIAHVDIESTTGVANSAVAKGAHVGGDGGGDRGTNGSGGALGGRQISTGSIDSAGFGKGEGFTVSSSSSSTYISDAVSGGGAGWFGGGQGTKGNSGAGGSGYVGGVPGYTFKDRYYKHLNEVGVNEGNGYAFIRYLGCQ